jgi:hypothetical protein
MSIFNQFKHTKVAKGIIGYLGLSDWWYESFTDDERRIIAQTYDPLGGCNLETGDVKYSAFSPFTFLSGIASWFSKDESRSIAYRILDKAAEYLSATKDPLDVHFYFQSQIEIYYRDRNTPEGLSRTIAACRGQIAHAPTAARAFKKQAEQEPLPSHKGYEQLAIIFEQQNMFQDTIDLCMKAKTEGWCGDWDKRIDRCYKKLKKAQQIDEGGSP